MSDLRPSTAPGPRGRFVTRSHANDARRASRRSTQIAAVRVHLPPPTTGFTWRAMLVAVLVIVAAGGALSAAIFWAAGGAPVAVGPILPPDVVASTRARAAASEAGAAEAMREFREHSAIMSEGSGGAPVLPPPSAPTPLPAALPLPAAIVVTPPVPVAPRPAAVRRPVIAADIAPPRSVAPTRPAAPAPAPPKSDAWVVTVPRPAASVAAPHPSSSSAPSTFATRAVPYSAPAGAVPSRPKAQRPAGGTPFKIVSIVQSDMVLVATRQPGGDLVRAYRAGDKLPNGSVLVQAIPGGKTVLTTDGVVPVGGL